MAGYYIIGERWTVHVKWLQLVPSAKGARWKTAHTAHTLYNYYMYSQIVWDIIVIRAAALCVFSRAAKWFNARRVTRFNIFVRFPAAGRKDPCGNAPSTSASIVAHHISEVYHFHLRLSDDDGSILLIFILDVQIRRAQQCRCQRIFQIWTDIYTFFSNAVSRYSVRVCVYIRLSCGNQSRDPKKSTIHEFQMSD